MRQHALRGMGLLSLALVVSALMVSTASAQISGVSITNTGDANFTNDGLTDGRQRLSTPTVVSTSTTIAARYAFVTAADSGSFTNSSISAANAYRVDFTVNVPGAYQLTVATNWNGGLTTVDDTTLATVAATADVGPLTGTQSGGTLSGTLSLTDPGTRTSGASGQTPFGGTLSALATINGTSNGSNVAHQLNFSWTSSCNSPGGGSLVGGDECAVRAGLASTLSGQTAGAYPGQGGRTIGSDGHFVNVSIVSLCGNGILDGAFGETCDEGGANGTPGSCCNSNCTLKTAGTPCRAAAGICDIAENCNGISGACPSDAFQAPSFVCRPTSVGEVCDTPEFCPGGGPNCPADAVLPNGTTCRVAAGGCDVTEDCDGVSKLCPSDAFVAGGTECRAAAGVCDIAEQCTGSGPNCPGNSKSTAVCRASGGTCDLTETCDGVNDDCPADAKSTAVCRAAGGICDVTEVCDGANDACPADAKVASGTECRSVMGICDVAEECDGANDTCPSDAFVSAGTECRGEAGVCDIAEDCTGTGPNCPADGFEPATTVCRASSIGEVCDIVENCTGSGPNCPADAVEPSSTLCRASSVGEVCDIAELCDGSNKTCPADAVEPGSTVCRAASSGETCDVTENCDGANKTCPADAVLPNGATCRGSAGVCDVTDVCDGASKVCPNDAKSTAVCRTSAGVCDVAEICDGANDDCPSDAFVLDGNSCDDALYCNGEQTCTGGVCGGGSSPCAMGESCDETGNVCFNGDCPVSPASCLTAAKNKVLIKNNATDGKDKLVWKWTKGANTTLANFSDPVVGTANYTLCFYAGATPALIQQASVPPAGGKWAALGTKGFKYKDSGGSNDGITKIIVKSSDGGKSKALVKGKGINLPDFNSDLPIAAPDLPLIVQLRNSQTGLCWGGSFATPKKNLAEQFNAKQP